MKESQFGFEYTWRDLQAIRPLTVTVYVAQIIGGISGLLLAPYVSWLGNLWAGAAIATFPSFLLGLLIQFRLDPVRIKENRVMVRRFGLVALALSLSVFVVPLGEYQ